MAQLAFIESRRLVDLISRTDPNGDMLITVLNHDELGLGTDPLVPTAVLSFSKESVRLSVTSDGQPIGDISPSILVKQESPSRNRVTGTYLFEIMNRTFECVSLKDLLAKALKEIERERPGTLDKLSTIQPRSKRIVARDPSLLFTSKELSEEYSERLGSGWWFGTNNSAQETKSWLKRACNLAGLVWGKEFSTSI
jgi:hypothetical protein